MPEFYVTLSRDFPDVKVEALNREEAIILAKQKAKEEFKVDEVKFHARTKGIFSDYEDDDYFNLEVQEHGIGNQENTVLFSKGLPRIFLPNFERTDKVLNPTEVFKELGKSEYSLDSIFKIGESSFFVDLLCRAFNYLVGLNGDETIQMYVGKDTNLYIQINQE